MQFAFSKICGALIVWTASYSALAAEQPEARAVLVEAVNDNPAFHVRVGVDHKDRTYVAGDVMKVTVQSNADGYLYLFYLSADTKTWMLFPNSHQTDNKIPAGKEVVVPAETAKFRLRVGPPFGKEVLKAVVTKAPLGVMGLDLGSLTKRDATEIELKTFQTVYEKVKAKPADWAEHAVEVTTVPKAVVAATKTEKRVGVFVGIGRYKDPGTSPIPFCKADAEAAAAAFKERCGLDEAIVLTDAGATRAKVEEVLRKTIPAKTRPGDTVILFWSGHGARLPDLDGKGREYLLVLHDTMTPKLPEKPRLEDVKKAIEELKSTSLPSIVLQRWLQELDGRRILIVADSCHASGLHAQGKSLYQDDSLEGEEEPFLGDLIRRGKALNQKELALIAGCRANEFSWPRREEDYSVLTYFLLKALKDGEGSLTLPQWFEQAKGPIATYMTSIKKEQTPMLIDQTTAPFVVRPSKKS